MFKIGIAGADTPVAGEVIRLLVNHPDVDIVTLFAPSVAGRKASDIHYGLIGESELSFTDNITPADLDAVIICDNCHAANRILANPDNFPELRIIDMTHSPEAKASGFRFGLSEIYRKPLVRGERLAYVPYPEEVLALAALYPLATRLLIPGDIDIVLRAHPAIVPDNRLAVSEEAIASHLRQAQLSFGGKVSLKREAHLSRRAIQIEINLPLSLSLDEIDDTFESIYDDHNFTFHLRRRVSPREVEGTHKSLITLEKPKPDSLRITAIADGLRRGGPSEAVHLLNLLFGLHERTALNLMATNLYDEP